MTTLSFLVAAAAIFASTNIDDLLLLSALFADPHLGARSIVIGQFLGIGLLFGASAVAALATLAVPEGWTALLGLGPLGLGLRGLLRLRGRPAAPDDGLPARRGGAPWGAQVPAVAGLVVASGGDNLGAYIPLFARAPAAIPAYAAIFAALTALWCMLGYAVANNRVLGGHVRRYGRVALPFILIALGLHILSDARAVATGGP